MGLLSDAFFFVQSGGRDGAAARVPPFCAEKRGDFFAGLAGEQVVHSYLLLLSYLQNLSAGCKYIAGGELIVLMREICHLLQFISSMVPAEAEGGLWALG